ncbi:zinc finger and BTB domain-containing protein 41-like [Tachypleus tridentatus]|uniref:zinc finger and BTB domain-containing protein 41-like n=1 Tax=Tachypleus tridentatus TaxID=6853 RepID=UPI003FD39F39
MKIHFPSREKFACFLCGTVVSRKDHLNRHMKWQHKDLVFICPICFLVSRPRLMQRDPGSLVCHFCLKVFSTRGSLSSHLYFQHTSKNRVTCSECGRVFSRRYNMIKHRSQCQR